jgi:DNA-directed RNA polymerase sigma subunit (sigma70/sigma32)
MVTQAVVDVSQLWRDYRTSPTVDLRNHLVENYLPLVKYNAERIWARLPEGVELDDLISAGVFGLMDAIDAFDLERGVKFETYCVPRIRGAMNAGRAAHHGLGATPRAQQGEQAGGIAEGAGGGTGPAAAPG